jgi:hypothetical protein
VAAVKQPRLHDAAVAARISATTATTKAAEAAVEVDALSRDLAAALKVQLEAAAR